MSLLITDASRTAKAAQDDADPEARQELARLTRYLAILEDNKKASRFVPDDAALAQTGCAAGAPRQAALWRAWHWRWCRPARTRPRNNALTHPRPSLWATGAENSRRAA